MRGLADICYHKGQLITVSEDKDEQGNGFLHCSALPRPIELGPDANGFGRLYSLGDDWYLGYRLGRADGYKIRLLKNGIKIFQSLELSGGNFPTCFGDGCFAFSVTSRNMVYIYDLRTEHLSVALNSAPGTGLSRISGRRVITIDEDNGRFPGLTHAHSVDDQVFVAELPNGGVRAFLKSDPKTYYDMDAGLVTNFPRVVSLPDNSYVAISWGHGEIPLIHAFSLEDLKNHIDTPVSPPTNPPIPEEPNVIPDYKHVVQEVANMYPEAFKNCHKESLGELAYEFVYRVAQRLYNIDARFGLCNKRGSGVLSWDAVTFMDGSDIRVLDIVIGAGGSNPSVGWSEVARDGALWVNPFSVTIPSIPVPTPTPPSNGVDLMQLMTKLNGIENLLNSIRNKQLEMETKMNFTLDSLRAFAGQVVDSSREVSDKLTNIADRNEKLAQSTQSAVVNQSQAVAAVVEAKANEVKAAAKCRFRF